MKKLIIIGIILGFIGWVAGIVTSNGDMQTNGMLAIIIFTLLDVRGKVSK